MGDAFGVERDAAKAARFVRGTRYAAGKPPERIMMDREDKSGYHLNLAATDKDKIREAHEVAGPAAKPSGRTPPKKRRNTAGFGKSAFGVDL